MRFDGIHTPAITPHRADGSIDHEAFVAHLERLIAAAAVSVRALAGLEPEKVVRTGLKSDEVVKLIEADEDISLLVLAAGTGSNGPGPLVSALAGKSAGTFPIPVAIVPGHLADEEIDALA